MKDWPAFNRVEIKHHQQWEHDQGTRCLCRSENPTMGTVSMEDCWMLEIQYTSETRIQPGTSLPEVCLDCPIHGDLSIFRVDWRQLEKLFATTSYD
ncbi:unnamed protein product [Xylocopa violacea]|uniref:Uncharacterized protein n=1 Tax=Xylocopa violacea TaxID=135666 RepID=A0ABP1P9J1_XYLVO